ncbi:hypothetical protein R50073_10350 [Maricurvus nonylphenolicus]|uniref:hypothetical protein n=1 Tax=Maricurvus nonylphenolicus TaxID=1008307 RepID=UPI0036F39ABC
MHYQKSERGFSPFNSFIFTSLFYIAVSQLLISSSFAKTVDVVSLMPPVGVLGQAPHGFASEVTALTNGSLEVRVKSMKESGVPLPAMIDQIDSGKQQVFVAPPETFFIQGAPQRFGILLTSGFPFGLNAQEYLSWYYNAGGQQLIQEIFDRKTAHANVLVFPLAVSTSEPPGFFTDSIPNDPDKFNNSNITYRINYLGSKAMKLAFPDLNMVTTPAGRVPVDDLCTGKINGTELGTLSLYDIFFFDKFSHPNGDNIVECGFKHLYLGSWQQLLLSSWMAINKTFFESLAPHEQQAIITVARAGVSRSLTTDIAKGARVLYKAAEAGVTIHSGLPPKVLDRLREATSDVLNSESEADSDFAKIVEGMKGFVRHNRPALLYDGVSRQQRFKLLPVWDSDYSVVEQQE